MTIFAVPFTQDCKGFGATGTFAHACNVCWFVNRDLYALKKLRKRHINVKKTTRVPYISKVGASSLQDTE